MIVRMAAALLLISQLLLLWVAWAPSGTSAIWFTFVGTPSLLVGVVLAIWAWRRQVSESSSSAPPR